MLIKACKTTEISNKEWKEIIDGFNETFDAKITVARFKLYYSSKCLGYSFHSLAIDETGEVVGSTTIVPYRYKDGNGRIFMTGLSGGSYIRKDYRRDEFLFSDMYYAIRKISIENGLELILGVPNNNSFLYLTKYLSFKYLFDLDFFVLPLRVSNLIRKGRFRIANYISLTFAFFWASVFYIIQNLLKSNTREKTFSIVVDDEFKSQRFDERYKCFHYKKYSFCYRIVDERNIKTAYILDFREHDKRTSKALSKAVWKVLITEKVDIVAFIGTMNIRQLVLFKMPAKMIPQRFRLIVDVLKNENPIIESFYLSPENWSFSLLNFDVR